MLGYILSTTDSNLSNELDTTLSSLAALRCHLGVEFDNRVTHNLRSAIPKLSQTLSGLAVFLCGLRAFSSFRPKLKSTERGALETVTKVRCTPREVDLSLVLVRPGKIE